MWGLPMDHQETKNTKRKKIPIGIWIYLALFIALTWIINLSAVNSWIAWLFMLLRPVLIGLALAYLLNPIFRFFERRVLSRLRLQSLRRVLALTFTYIAVLAVLSLIVLLIVPQLIDSIISFLNSYNAHFSSAIAQVNNIFSHINAFIERFTGNESLLEYLNEAEIREKAAELFANLDKTSDMLMDFLSGVDIKPIQDFVGEAISIVTDSIFGIFVSIYLLSTKEKRYAQIMKLRRALFSNKTNERITRFCTVADRSFGGFVEGKLLDSLLVGILLYILFTIFRIPYAIVLATFIAITNIIPLLGLIIGSIPAVFILLLAAPSKLLPFILIMLIMQQIDVNIISPKILGTNTGVSSLCIIISISVMSHFWGLLGMLLAVPIFATALELFDEYLVSSLQRRGMPSGLANYYAPDAVVDPTKNAAMTYDNAIQRFEKRAHYVLNRRERGEKLSRRESFLLSLYYLARKYRLLTDMSDETDARYAAEEAVHAAELEADMAIERIRAERAAETERLKAEPEVSETTDTEDPTDAPTTESTDADSDETV